MKSFKAIIQYNSKNGGSWVYIPFDVEKEYGTKGRVPIKSTLDGIPYVGSIVNMGAGTHILLVKKAIREKLNKSEGDEIEVTIEKDTTERTVVVPKELQQLLEADKDLKEFYESLSYTNRKEYADWISSAKRDSTKESRLEQIKEKLAAKLKNPFVK